MSNMYTINPGEFKHYIEIQKLTPGKDKDNIPCEKWDRVIKTKARIQNKGVKETFIGDGINSENTKLITIRYPKGINLDEEDTKRYRIEYKGKQYNIIYMSNVRELNVYLEILMERVV